MNGRTVQRTVVLTFGPLAVAAGEELKRLLATDGQPAAAVVLVAGDDIAGPDGRERLVAAIEAVSRAGLRRDLARAGWTLDRLDELGLVVLVDTTADKGGAAGSVATTAVDFTREVARARLGIGVGALVLALCPEPGGDDRDRLRGLLADPVFDRGAVALGRARLDGLRLESADALVLAAAGLAQALITTPLRDAPTERVAIRLLDHWEHTLTPSPAADDGEADGLPVLSLGIARWDWPAAAARAALAHRWASAALDGWLDEPAVDALALNAQAFGWLEKQGASPEALVAPTDELVPSPPIPLWHAPQPWAVRAALDHQRPSFSTGVSADVPAGEDGLAGRVAGWSGAARAVCRDALQKEPTGGLARARGWIAALQAQSARLVEQAAARQEREGEAAIDLERQAAGLETSVNALLDNWPPDDPAAWLPLLARPWRWPRLGLTYAALNRAGRARREWAASRAVLAREQAISAILLATYARWAAELERLDGQLEEVGEMLRFVRDGLLVASAPSEMAPSALYDSLTADPLEEAARAATAAGGLGRQLDALDDSFVAALESAGWERFAAVQALDAVAALPAFYPTAGAATAWWSDLYDEATPLWPAVAGRPARDAASAVVLSSDPSGLRTWVGEAGVEAVRWLPGPDGDSIVLVRLAAVVV